MTCEEFEQLLADALGDELSESDQIALDRHLGTCESCRSDHASTMRTVDTMRSLSTSKSVHMRRDGQRWIVNDVHTDSANAIGLSTSRLRGNSVFRWAASILIAFTAGYAFHAAMMIKGAIEQHEPTTAMGTADGGVHKPMDVQGALLLAHAAKPSRANLAKALTVLGKSRR